MSSFQVSFDLDDNKLFIHLPFVQVGSSPRQVQQTLLRRSQLPQYNMGAAAAVTSRMGDEARSSRPRLLRRPQRQIVSFSLLFFKRLFKVEEDDRIKSMKMFVTGRRG